MSSFKIAFVVVLAVILIAGIFLLLKTPDSLKTPDDGSGRGFLSFFGNRKTLPDDEPTVPGVITANGSTSAGGSGSGDQAGSDGTGTGTAGGNTGGHTGGGSLPIRSIGTNTVSTNSNGGTGAVGGTGTLGGTSSTGSTGNTGGTGSTGGMPNPTITQIDCTPPQLPYTQEEINNLKSLTQDFYRIAANLHTESDIANELDTRKSYFDLYNQAVTYTKQCYAELKDPKNASKAQNSSARWHPYLTEAVIQRISGYDPRVALTPLTDKAKLQGEIDTITAIIASDNAQIDFFDPPASSVVRATTILSPTQKVKLDSLRTEVAQYNVILLEKKDKLSKITKPTVIAQDILGTFFVENVFNGKNLVVARENINFRRNNLWREASGYLLSTGNNDIHAYFYCGEGADCVNRGFPLRELILNPLRAEGYLDTAGQGKRYVHQFREFEDGLRIW